MMGNVFITCKVIITFYYLKINIIANVYICLYIFILCSKTVKKDVLKYAK